MSSSSSDIFLVLDTFLIFLITADSKSLLFKSTPFICIFFILLKLKFSNNNPPFDNRTLFIYRIPIWRIPISYSNISTFIKHPKISHSYIHFNLTKSLEEIPFAGQNNPYIYPIRWRTTSRDVHISKIIYIFHTSRWIKFSKFKYRIHCLIIIPLASCN